MDLDIPVAERAAGSRTTGTPRSQPLPFRRGPGPTVAGLPLAHSCGAGILPRGEPARGRVLLLPPRADRLLLGPNQGSDHPD